jgi:hypothetical protein
MAFEKKLLCLIRFKIFTFLSFFHAVIAGTLNKQAGRQAGAPDGWAFSRTRPETSYRRWPDDTGFVRCSTGLIKETVIENYKNRFNTVFPRDFFTRLVIAPAIADGDLIDPGIGLGNFHGKFRLKTKTVTAQAEFS